MILGQYQNKHDGSILEVYKAIERKEVKLKGKWIQAKTKQGHEFDLTENFNKFETFEKLTTVR